MSGGAGGGRRPLGGGLLFLAAPLAMLLVFPLAALFIASSPGEVIAGIRSPLFGRALWLSGRTTLVTLAIVVAGGTPLAWWLATGSGRVVRVAEVLVDLPIVVPPAVVGIALLEAFGRGGLLGPQLSALGVQLPFTTAAVVLAQVVVSAPFYVQAAAAAFRRVDPDLRLVARTLGQTSTGAFFRVAVPVAFPGIVGGAALAWGRALGEFGATLIFAGNLPGTTQTMPLAIYAALEADVRAAVALSLVLVGVAAVLLFALRTLPGAWAFVARTQVEFG